MLTIVEYMMPNDEREQDRLGRYQLIPTEMFMTDGPLFRPPARVPNGWISIKKYRVSSPVCCSLESLINGVSHTATLYFLMDIHPLGTLPPASLIQDNAGWQVAYSAT